MAYDYDRRVAVRVSQPMQYVLDLIKAKPGITSSEIFKNRKVTHAVMSKCLVHGLIRKELGPGEVDPKWYVKED